jgi:membrane fusion protein
MIQTRNSLFRQEALEHFLQAEEGRGIIRVSPPWTWVLLLALLGLVGSAVAAALLGKVEVNGRGRGILRPVSGVRVVIGSLDGTVARVEAHSGQSVRRGAVLARIEAPPVQAQLLEADRQVAAVRRDFRATGELQDRAHGEQARRLRARMAKLEEQIASQRASVERLELRTQRGLALAREGILSPSGLDELREARAQVQRELYLSEHGLEQAAQEWAALEHQRQELLWNRKQTIQTAESRQAALAFILGQTLLQAPEDGQVEAMLVKPGEAVRSGQPLCKLIPRDAQLHAIVFLAEKDRAFVRKGDAVLLELDQLPYAEYGTVRAEVTRISEDLASPFELQEALGEGQGSEGPVFRIELRILEAKAAGRAGVPLRSGMLLNGRFTLRRQRLATLVLDPLRKWFR